MLTDVDEIRKGVRDYALWKDLTSVIVVVSERGEKGKSQTETRFYISSRVASARQFAGWARNHWGIENPQPDDWRSNNLCEVGGTGYDRTRGPSGAGRVVRPAPRPRRHPMSDNDPVLGPPRR
ncbi:Mobile element protein [Fimbriiglobus ruber]|uniref:Mobile element protein n=1 Tax=Fimbriiglobus ruber TaxID=1908690 RepID=A0A225DQZ5_9BACT|nr:Mobile element protein [Fimbriiglobus ruber]